jgi:hypothetical protein
MYNFYKAETTGSYCKLKLLSYVASRWPCGDKLGKWSDWEWHQWCKRLPFLVGIAEHKSQKAASFSLREPKLHHHDAATLFCLLFWKLYRMAVGDVSTEI